MKPQDVIEQLVGTGSGWDQVDTMAFVLYNPAKFHGADSASVDFEKGTVCVQRINPDNVDDIKEDHFAIVAKLEPCDPPDKTESEEGA